MKIHIKNLRHIGAFFINSDYQKHNGKIVEIALQTIFISIKIELDD